MLSTQGFSNLRLWPRGVDLSLFTPTRRCHSLREQWGVGPNDVVVLYVGRVSWEKNLKLLIEAYRLVCEQRKEEGDREVKVKLVLVGDGPARVDWERECPEGTICMGHQKGEELAKMYASSDIFGFPSMTDTFGSSLLLLPNRS